MQYIGSILTLIGAIWIVVNAFKKDGALPGILCLICGFYTIYYGAKNFAENKIPLILFLVGLAISISVGYSMGAQAAAAGM